MTRLIEGNSRAFPGNRKENSRTCTWVRKADEKHIQLCRWFCLNTDGEGGEEVGAESVRVEGESVIDESCAEIV